MPLLQFLLQLSLHVLDLFLVCYLFRTDKFLDLLMYLTAGLDRRCLARVCLQGNLLVLQILCFRRVLMAHRRILEFCIGQAIQDANLMLYFPEAQRYLFPVIQLPSVENLLQFIVVKAYHNIFGLQVCMQYPAIRVQIVQAQENLL